MPRTLRSIGPTTVPPRSAARAAFALATLLPLVACGGGGGDSATRRPAPRTAAERVAAERPCPPGTGEAIGVAVTDYIKRAQPKPQRFLVSVGTDSALPDGGLRALQDKGPTYLFPGSAALQAQARALLHEKGDYTTLLVVLKEATRQERAASVRLDGHYVGGEEEGKTAGPRSFQLECFEGKWRLLGKGAPERST